MAVYNLALELAEESQLVGSLCSEESGAPSQASVAPGSSNAARTRTRTISSSNEVDSAQLPSAHELLEKARRFCVRALELDRSNLYATHLLSLILSANARLNQSSSLERALALIDTAIAEWSASNLYTANLQYVLYSIHLYSIPCTKYLYLRLRYMHMIKIADLRSTFTMPIPNL